MNSEIVFVKATKQKLRFKTGKGNFTVENLWDLSLPDLDKMAVAFDTELQKSPNKSFISETNQENKVLQLKFDVIKYIIDYKMKALETSKKRSETLAQKTMLTELLAEKEKESLKNMSKEDIAKKLAELGS